MYTTTTPDIKNQTTSADNTKLS